MSANDLIDLDAVALDPSCAMRISADFALARNVLPLCVVDSDFLVAMADVTDVKTVAEIRRELEMPVIAKRADPAKLQILLRKVYGEVRTALADAETGSALSIVDYLLRLAYMRHASDIHFDPSASGVRVRFRIDGELSDVLYIDSTQQASVVSRLKVMGDLKLDERRAPQDGAFAWRVPAAFAGSPASLDVRMATLPGHYGERVTLRLLETESKRYTLDSVGLSSEDEQIVNRVLDQPSGLFLLTGPTGSGKTSTLYAAIQRLLEKRALNIMTVENPIEYEIPGIFQAEIDGADKVNFSKALRSILRHDPDVIMIGEIRDEESLDTAVKAALTGHLVLSTLHTNDAVGSIARLANMGVERHMIAATLRLAVAQRLVRTLCPYCREQYLATERDAWEAGGMDAIVGQPLYRARGCVYCAGRGLRGRTGLFELFRPDLEIAEAICDGMREHDLRRLCRTKGIHSLRDDGLAKAFAGITTLREVSRVSLLG